MMALAPMEQSTQVYYAAALGPEARHAISTFEPKNFVSPRKDEIIEISKRHKGSRFKGFRSFEEALKYAKDEPIETESIDRASKIGEEKFAPPFPSLETKKLTPFKIEVERNNVNSIKTFINENPRYLLSYCNDGPTILMQGPRYNAVHLAVRKDADTVLKFVLDMIDSSMFIRRCYPFLRKPNDIQKERNHLLDLYLNTPDKCNFDTPLHMACKNGSLKCIKILLEYVPMLDLTRKNKQDLLPRAVIRDEKLKPQIEQLLDACMFITVTRSSDNLTFKVSEPSCGRKSVPQSPPSRLNKDKDLPQVSAIVGPMTLTKAKDIYETLRSPKRCPPQLKSLRLKDPIRGVEKMARGLCYDSSVPFEEYWPVRQDFIDLSSINGLEKLNKHLNKVHDELVLSEVMGNMSLNDSEPDCPDEPQTRDVFYDANENVADVYWTPPTSPTSLVSSLILQKTFFINGTSVSAVDYELLSAMEMSLEKGNFSTGDLKEIYPFVYHWFFLTQNARH